MVFTSLSCWTYLGWLAHAVRAVDKVSVASPMAVAAIISSLLWHFVEVLTIRFCKMTWSLRAICWRPHEQRGACRKRWRVTEVEVQKQRRVCTEAAAVGSHSHCNNMINMHAVRTNLTDRKSAHAWTCNAAGSIYSPLVRLLSYRSHAGECLWARTRGAWTRQAGVRENIQQGLNTATRMRTMHKVP
jgi:hypothetical protein